MRFLTIGLFMALGLVIQAGFILACSLILDKPFTILLVGIVFGVSVTYAVAIIMRSKNPIVIGGGGGGDGEHTTPLAWLGIAGVLVACGFYAYASDRPYYLLYKEIPHIAAAMIFLPGTLVGCGAIVCLMAGRALSR